MKIFGLQIPYTSNDFLNKKESINPYRKEKSFAVGGNGGTGSYRSDGSKWNGGISGTGSSMTYDHWSLRNNSNNAYQDSIHAHGMVNRWADSISDIGLKLDCNPNVELLGISPEAGEKWATNTEQRFNLWAQDTQGSRSETINFYQSHRLFQLDDKRDGENFIRLYYSNEQKLQNPLQFEFISPNQIRGDAYTSTLGPYATDDGIIRDERGREKAYKIWSSKFYNNNYEYKDLTIPRIGPKSKRIMMLHCYMHEFPGQKRGLPPFTHALQEFQNITDFTLAEIKKAINQSNIVMGVENNIQDASNPTENMPISVPGASGFNVPADSECDPTTATIADDGPDVIYNAMPEVDLSTPGSTSFFNLKQGDKLKFLENTAPTDGFDKFVTSFMTNISASTGMPIEVLQMKFSSSFSAARGALLMFYRVALIHREQMAASFLNPVFEMWLNEEIAAGRISAPGWKDPVLKKAWLNCTWIGAPMPNIDPMRTAKADKEYLMMGSTTPERVARSQNGSDAKANIMKNTKTFGIMPLPPWEKQNTGANNG